MKRKGRSRGEGQRGERQNDGDRRVPTEKKGRDWMKETLSVRQKQKVKETTADMKFERAKHCSMRVPKTVDTRLSHAISSGPCELFEGGEYELMNNAAHLTAICTFKQCCLYLLESEIN